MPDMKSCNGLIAQLSNPVKAAETAIEEYKAEEAAEVKKPYSSTVPNTLGSYRTCDPIISIREFA